MAKAEWNKKKYKTGKWFFKNVAIGPHAPAGQPVKVTLRQGLKKESKVIPFGGTYTLTPTADTCELTFKPQHNDMQPVVMKFTKALQYEDYTMYIAESLHKYSLAVGDRHILSPEADSHV